MNYFILGLCKTGFAFAVGVLGIWFASYAICRLLRWGDIDRDIKEGNVAAGIMKASCIISVGILLQHPVSATFNALDLIYRGQEFAFSMLIDFALYAAGHVGITLLIGLCALSLGVGIFDRLTGSVDELTEIRRGNIPAALVLGAVILVLAFVVTPGLQLTLDGLLPLPDFGAGIVTPS